MCPSSGVGLPINVGSGDVMATQHLFTMGQDPFPLPFALSYHSSTPMFPSLVSAPVGLGWTHPFAQTLRPEDASSNRLYHITPEGFEAEYARIAPDTTWIAINPGELRSTVTQVGPEYRLTDVNGTVTRFEIATGNWLATTDRWGNSVTGWYTSGQLTKVTDSEGREFLFTYASGQVTITLPEGKVWKLLLGTNNTLTRIFDPVHAGAIPWHKFSYQNDHLGSLRLLTSIKDDADQELEAHTYEATTDRGLTSSQAGGTRSNVTVVYPTATTRTVTHTIGGGTQETSTFTLAYLLGRWLPTQISGPCTTCGGSSADLRVFAYDYGNRVTSRKDGSGADQVETRFTYDANGMLLTRQEAVGTTVARLTTYAYDYTAGTPASGPPWPAFATSVTEASVGKPGQSKTTTYAWNSSGTAETTLTATVTGWLKPTDSMPTSYTTTTLFDSRHRRTSVAGSGTNQKSVFAYFDDADAILNRRGRLKSTALYTSAAAHLDTLYDDYDLFGTAGKVVDANGVTTARLMDEVGRVTSVTSPPVAGDPAEAASYTTTYTFDTRDRLMKVTLPRGNQTQYVYENGTNRLTDTIRADSSGIQRERLHLTLNVIGGKTSEEAQSCGDATPSTACAAWVTKRSETFAYDTSNRLSSVIHPGSPAPHADFTYDTRGNLKTVRDERHPAANTTYTYDGLNRLTGVAQTLSTAPGGQAITTYGYDSHDNLRSVLDPNSNSTTYEYDDFRRMQKQVSPVTGTSTYSYDAASNLLTSTDGRGALTTRTYDAASRLLTSVAQMPGRADEKVSYAYDTGDPAKYLQGRAISMTDPAGQTLYSYDRRGLVKAERRSVLSATYATSYGYDANGNRSSITYPSGNVVTYGFDFADRHLTSQGTSATYVTNARYMPFGPLQRLDLGNGLSREMTFDQDRYLPASLKLMNGTTSIADYSYLKDAGGNITTITDGKSAGYNRTFGYDDLSRLTTATTGVSLWGTGSYTYDAMGNALTTTLGTSRSATFSYQLSGGHTLPLLTSVTETGLGARSVAYDASGNEAGLGTTQSFVYSPRNFLQSATDRSVSTDGFFYLYDGRGVRTATIDTHAGQSLLVTAVNPGAAPPSSGPVQITVDGFPFSATSTVYAGATALLTQFISPTRLTATLSPGALTAGSYSPVTVHDGAAVSNGFPFLVEFSDVPSTHWAYPYVNTILNRGVTAGCGAGAYCPTNVVSRAQMAVFIINADSPLGYVPPACTTPRFTDVSCSHWAARWINEFGARGYTSGCGGGAYCPENPVLRQEMSVFLLRGEHGPGYAPPSGTPQIFTDVPVGYPFFYDWINQLAREGITGGCGVGVFCPLSQVTRDQMAVFLTLAFKLTPAGATAPTSNHRYHLYDPDLHLLTETTYTTSSSPLWLYENVWFNGQPVAQEVAGGVRSFITTDHLGTPFVMTNASKTPLWWAEYEPFGRVFGLHPGTGDQHQPLRLPGQEAEQLPDIGTNGATGRFYNIFRWYRPNWGRYTQPDPATFAWSVFPDQYPYATLNPMRNTDPIGLFSVAKNCSGALFGEKLAAGIRDFCGKLRPGTKCHEALKNINAALGNKSDALPRCMQEACDGTQTLGCDDCQAACGANYPSFGRPVIVVGPGQMSSCPVSKGLGFGPTIFHETLHTCGFGGTDPHLANTEASWFRYAEMACFGWRDPNAPPFGPPRP